MALALASSGLVPSDATSSSASRLRSASALSLASCSVERRSFARTVLASASADSALSARLVSSASLDWAASRSTREAASLGLDGIG